MLFQRLIMFPSTRYIYCQHFNLCYSKSSFPLLFIEILYFYRKVCKYKYTDQFIFTYRMYLCNNLLPNRILSPIRNIPWSLLPLIHSSAPAPKYYRHRFILPIFECYVTEIMQSKFLYVLFLSFSVFVRFSHSNLF